jgi:hypothetical protein
MLPGKKVGIATQRAIIGFRNASLNRSVHCCEGSHAGAPSEHRLPKIP